MSSTSKPIYEKLLSSEEKETPVVGHTMIPSVKKWPWCRVCHTPHPPNNISYFDLGDKKIPLCPGHSFMQETAIKVCCSLCSTEKEVRETIFTDVGYVCRNHDGALNYNPPSSPLKRRKY